jgi:hypothetical protein
VDAYVRELPREGADVCGRSDERRGATPEWRSATIDPPRRERRSVPHGPLSGNPPRGDNAWAASDRVWRSEWHR